MVNLPDGPGPREGAGWGQDRVLIEAKGVAPSYLGGWLKVVAIHSSWPPFSPEPEIFA